MTEANRELSMKTCGARLLVRMTLLYGQRECNRALLGLLFLALLYVGANIMPRY